MKHLSWVLLLLLALSSAGCRSDIVFDKTGKTSDEARSDLLLTIETYLIEADQKMKKGLPALHEFQYISDALFIMRVLWDEVPQEQDYWKNIAEVSDEVTAEMIKKQEPMTRAMFWEIVLQPISSATIYDDLDRSGGKPGADRMVFLCERRAFTYYLLDRPADSVRWMKFAERALAGLEIKPMRLAFFYLQWAFYLHEIGQNRDARRKLDYARGALAEAGSGWPLYYTFSEKDLATIRNCIAVLSAKI